MEEEQKATDGVRKRLRLLTVRGHLQSNDGVCTSVLCCVVVEHEWYVVVWMFMCCFVFGRAPARSWRAGVRSRPPRRLRAGEKKRFTFAAFPCDSAIPPSKARAFFAGSVEEERTALHQYVRSLEESALEAMQKSLMRKWVSAQELEALLDKYPEKECVSKDLKVARRALVAKQSEMGEQEKVVDEWRHRMMSMINRCRLPEAETVLVELGTKVSSDMVLALAKEHSAMHMYVQQLRKEAVQTLSSLQDSTDIGALLEAVAENGDVSDPEVRALSARLQERARKLTEESQTIAGLRIELMNLVQTGGVGEIERALKKSELFDSQLREERIELREQVYCHVWWRTHPCCLPPACHLVIMLPNSPPAFVASWLCAPLPVFRSHLACTYIFLRNSPPPPGLRSCS